MQLATVLNPPSDHNLKLAAQCGVTDIVTRYSGPELQSLIDERDRFDGDTAIFAPVEYELRDALQSEYKNKGPKADQPKNKWRPRLQWGAAGLLL